MRTFVILCLLTSLATAQETNWHLLIYDGGTPVSIDPTPLPEEVCNQRAAANNQAFKAGADALHVLTKAEGLAPPPRYSAKCEQRSSIN